MTKELGKDEMHIDARLIICFMKLHIPVVKVNIARWLGTMLCMSGIDVSQFSADSVPPAVALKVRAAECPLLAL